MFQGLDLFGRRLVRPVKYLIGAFKRPECLKTIQILSMCRRWHFLRGLVLDQEMATSSMYHRPEAVDEHGLGDLLRGDGVLLRLVDRAGQTPEQLLAGARLLPVAHQQPRPVHARPLEVQRLHSLLRLALKNEIKQLGIVRMNHFPQMCQPQMVPPLGDG